MKKVFARASLQLKLILPLITAGMVMCGFAGWLVVSRFNHRLDETLLGNARSVAYAVASAADTVSDADGLQRFVSTMGATEGIHLIVVAAGNPPRVVTSTRQDWRGALLADIPEFADGQNAIQQTIWAQLPYVRKRQVGNRELIDYAIPVQSFFAYPLHGALLLDQGAVMLQVDSQALAGDMVREYAWVMMLLLALMTVMLIVLIWIVLRIVLRPLSAIRFVINQRSQGDKTALVSVSSYDEIGQLAVSLNSMFTVLQRRQHQLQSLVNNMPGVTYRARWEDGRRVMVYLSSAVEELCGYTPADLLREERQLDFDRLIHPGDQQRVRSEIQAAVNGLRKYSLQYRIRHADGRILWLLEQGQASTDRSPSLVWIDGVVSDITDRVVDEESLRALTERFRLATEAAQLCVWEWDLLSDILVWDEKMYRLYGIEQVAGKDMTMVEWRNSLHPEDLERAVSVLERAVSGGEDYSTQFRILRPDGGLRYVRANAIIQRDDTGRAVRLIGVNRDITVQVLNEEAIRSREEILRVFFETAYLGIVAVDRDGQIEMFNRKAEEMFGYRRDDIIGRRVEMLLPDKDRPRSVRLRREYMKKPVGTVIETRAQRADGELFEAEVALTPITTEGKDLVMGFVIDVTTRRNAERALLELSRTRSEFVSVISHELRTPLTVIKGAVDSVLDDVLGPITREQRNMLETAIRNVNRLSKLINDVSQFQRLEAAASMFKMERQDIVPVLRRQAERYRAAAEEKGLGLAVQIPDQDIMVVFDNDLIERAMEELLGNAVTFSEKGVIKVVVERMTHQVRVSVVDEGIGIRPEDASQVFDSFKQVDDAGSRKTGGTGLGLAIARRIVELHEGNIGVHSKIGEGSRFYFLLPLADVSQDTDGGEAGSGEGTDPGASS